MLFNSINFMIFFPIVVLIYFIIPDKLIREQSVSGQRKKQLTIY